MTVTATYDSRRAVIETVTPSSRGVRNRRDAPRQRGRCSSIGASCLLRTGRAGPPGKRESGSSEPYTDGCQGGIHRRLAKGSMNMEVVNNVRALLRLMLAPQGLRASSLAPTEMSAEPATQPEDSLDLSGNAVRRSGSTNRAARDDDLTAIRADLVDSVRRQIELGNYDTPEKLDAAIGRMLDETEALDVLA